MDTNLNRFVHEKHIKSLGKKVIPRNIKSVEKLHEAEQWRNEIISEIYKNITLIQNGNLGEYRIRELNDLINNLLREKLKWEKHIYYGLNGTKYETEHIKDVIDIDGYYYFGAAKELPGIRELLETRQLNDDHIQKKTVDNTYVNQYDLLNMVDDQYYGYNNHNNIEQIQQIENEWRNQLEIEYLHKNPNKYIASNKETSNDVVVQMYVNLPNTDQIKKNY